jgi:hypothetical protein
LPIASKKDTPRHFQPLPVHPACVIRAKEGNDATDIIGNTHASQGRLRCNHLLYLGVGLKGGLGKIRFDGTHHPAFELNLDVQPSVTDQEMQTQATTGVIYWEGSIVAVGTRQGRPIRAKGYVEMTGYDKDFDAPM